MQAAHYARHHTVFPLCTIHYSHNTEHSVIHTAGLRNSYYRCFLINSQYRSFHIKSQYKCFLINSQYRSFLIISQFRCFLINSQYRCFLRVAPGGSTAIVLHYLCSKQYHYTVLLWKQCTIMQCTSLHSAAPYVSEEL